MATSETEEPSELFTATDEAFPAVEMEKELNPSLNTEVEVDPISSQVAADMEIKEKAEAVEKKKKRREKERREAMQTLKSAIVISAAFVAVAGAAFAVTKKLKEK